MILSFADTRLRASVIWSFSTPAGGTEDALTFSADSSEVSDLHQHAREHVRFVGATAASVDLQSFKKRLLQLIHFLRLLQIHTI